MTTVENSDDDTNIVSIPVMIYLLFAQIDESEQYCCKCLHNVRALTTVLLSLIEI